ncbi:MAG: glycoside hydrolase family 127 protein, partial [Bacteroidetes bacterium]|nr:glycoside hydrolase family 127 protein [Bacteroidota bacterium]
MIRTLSISSLVLIVQAVSAQKATVGKIPLQQIPVPARSVTSVTGFAGGRLEKNRINYLDTFSIGDYVRLVEQRSWKDWNWRKGEQPGKWIESAILTSERTHDTALAAKARAMLARMIASQEPDGYLGITDKNIRTPEKPLRGMDAYELYFTLHALLTDYEEWHDTKGLEAARRLGDYFVQYIGSGKAEFWPSKDRYPDNMGKTLKGTQHSDLAGHSIHYGWEGTLLIDPMMRLYQQTGDKKYLDWCKWVVSRIDVWSGWNAYSRMDSVATGLLPANRLQPYVHAHTFQMNFLGMLRLYQVTGDPSHLRKVEGIWSDINKRQTYITGGVSVGEHYERDYIKPLTGEMIETCATMSWLQ